MGFLWLMWDKRGVWVECVDWEEVEGKSKVNKGQVGVCLGVCMFLVIVVDGEKGVSQIVVVLMLYVK